MNKQNKKADFNWSKLSLDRVLKEVRVSDSGLSSQEAHARQQEFSLNILPKRQAPSFLIIFLRQFLSPLIYILLIAAAISLMLWHIEDLVFIGGVIFLNAAVGAWQENKAEKNAAALQNLLEIKSLVRRDNLEQEIEAKYLTIGDIVILESGYKIPADIRLIESSNLRIDESFLTGESEAVEKKAINLSKALPINQQVNMVFAGATVLNGRALGVVVAIGQKTEVGKIANLINQDQGVKPPLILRMEKFTKNIAIIILFLCFLLAAVALSRGMALSDTFFLAVALAVSAIPESLPVAMTIALSVATTRMSKRNVIVRQLTAVEALGACTMIASDKTGTLTVNQQTAKIIHLASGTQLKVSGAAYRPEGDIEGLKEIQDSDKKLLDQSLEVMVLANEASLYQKNKKWYQHGDTMDLAFLALAHKAHFDFKKLEKSVIKLLRIPYESERRYAAEIYQKNNKNYLAVKGSVAKVLEFCPQDAYHKEIKEMGLQLAAQGYRVLALAQGSYKAEVPTDINGFSENKIKNLKFLALVGFIDPLRLESKAAIKECQRAGIGVKIVTGDHPATAFHIAQELGIANNKEEVINGEKLDPHIEITPEFLEIIKRIKVFAGVSPLQKVKIVKALVQLGHFVAVTGDGVNDAPAMKSAHIGVAMGSGTDVAKETSLMIVKNDNFASIVSAIEEGRVAYNNVRKVVYFVISSGAAEIGIFLLAIIASVWLSPDNLLLPLGASQLLWLNVVTNGIQDVALAFESKEKNEMNKTPRPPQEGIFNNLMTKQVLISGLIMAVISFFTWAYLINSGESPRYASNYILMLMVLFQSIHAFNCRSEEKSTFRIPLKNNLLLIFGVITAQSLHIAATYIPFFQKSLNLEPIRLHDWFFLLLLASSILLGMELFKWLQSKKIDKITKN